MPNLSWFPINPTLTETGSFSAFSYEENGTELKPVSLGDGDTQFTSTDVFQNSYSKEAASNLGIGGNSLEGDYNSRIFSYELMTFSEKTTQSPIGGKIYGTRWGAGVRLFISISELKSSVSFKFGAIAASAELGLLKAEYRINIIGIKNPAIIKLLPTVGDFDFQTYKKIQDGVDAIKIFMADNPTSLLSVPFQVFISDEINKDIFLDSRAIIFAMRNIVQGNSLDVTIKNANNKYNISAIKSSYAKVKIFDGITTPTKEQKRIAESFLNT